MSEYTAEKCGGITAHDSGVVYEGSNEVVPLYKVTLDGDTVCWCDDLGTAAMIATALNNIPVG